MLILPNRDILVAEGKGGSASALKPKDVIAGYIKSKGTTPVKGGDRLTLLRDAGFDAKAIQHMKGASLSRKTRQELQLV